jgi:hypothetical protein
VGITTRRSGPPVKFDAEKAAKVIGAFVPGAILRRTAQGTDANGEAFKPYAPSYRRTLGKMGEDQSVDLRLTGGLMNSVKVRGKSLSADGVSVTVAPDTGTSAQVAPVKGRAKRTGERGPPHNVLGYWLHHGTAHMRARPFMGLSPAQRDQLNMLLAKAGLWG